MSWEPLQGRSGLTKRFGQSIAEGITRHIYFIIFSAVLVGLVSLAMFVIVGLAMEKSIFEIVHNWARAWTDLWGYLPK